jgi:phage FluMu protein Com
MSTTVRCSQCQQPLLLREECIGHLVRCPSCQATFKVEVSGMEPEEAPTASRPPSRRPTVPSDFTRERDDRPPPPARPKRPPRQTTADDFTADPDDEDRPARRASAAERTGGQRRSRRGGPHFSLGMRVLDDSDGELAGRYEADLSEDGLELMSEGKVVLFIPTDTETEPLGGEEIEVNLSRRTLRLGVARSPGSRTRVAQDVASFLNGDGELPRRDDYTPRGSPLLMVAAALAALLLVAGLGVGGYYLVRLMTSVTRVDESLWREFTPPGANCKVLMPGNPTTQSQNPPGLDGPLTMHAVELKRPNSAFLVGHARIALAEMGRMSLNQRFEGARQGMLSNARGASLNSQRDITLAGCPGREYVLKVKQHGQMIVRLYIDGRDLYMLLAGGDDFTPDNPDVCKFLDSFTLTRSPAIPVQPQPGLPQPGQPQPGQPQPPVPPFPPVPPTPPGERYPIPLVKALGEGARGRMEVAAFSPDGRCLVAGSDLWDTTTWQRTATLPLPGAASAVVFGHDSRAVAAATGNAVFLLDERGLPQALADRRPAADKIQDLALSPDGQTLAAWADSALILWDVPSRRNTAILPLPRHPWKPRAQFTPDGTGLIVSDGKSTIAVCDPRTGQVRKSIPLGPAGVTAFALLPGSTQVAAAGGGQVKLGDLVTGRLVSPLGASGGEVRALAFGPGGRVLAWVDTTGNLDLWDMTARRSLIRFRAHHGGANAVSFSPDGRRVATCGNDGQTRVWDISELLNGNRPGIPGGGPFPGQPGIGARPPGIPGGRFPAP